MGYPTCFPWRCPKFAFLITGSFILKNGQAFITPDPLTSTQLFLQQQTCRTSSPPTSEQLCLKVEAHVKQAFDALKEENKTADCPAAIPDYGIIILLGGKDGELSDARVLAFIPLTAPTDNTKRMSPQRAVDLYQTAFINRGNPSDKFYSQLVEASLQQPIVTAPE